MGEPRPHVSPASYWEGGSAPIATARGRRRPGAVPLLVLILVGLPSCGKKGTPEPPLRLIPAPIRDLSVRQQGHSLILDMTYPRLTTSGMALPGLQAVEIWEVVRPLPSSGEITTLDPREFAAAAERRVVFQGTDLAGFTVGDRLRLRLSLEDFPGQEARIQILAVRTVALRGERSELSNQAAIVPGPPPDPPEGLQVTPREDGIEIAWTATADPPTGFHLYRREAHGRTYTDPLHAAPPEARSHLDRTARYDHRYIYTVTAVASTQPLVESAPGPEREVLYRDVFAPPPPGELLALPEAGQVRLVWQASQAPDVAGYLIDRQDPGAEYRRITPEPVPGLDFLDTGLVSGLTYRYRLKAVDRAGNEGEASDEVTAEVR